MFPLLAWYRNGPVSAPTQYAGPFSVQLESSACARPEAPVLEILHPRRVASGVSSPATRRGCTIGLDPPRNFGFLGLSSDPLHVSRRRPRPPGGLAGSPSLDRPYLGASAELSKGCDENFAMWIRNRGPK